MQYGPFYPASVSGAGWSDPSNAVGAPDGSSATVVVGFDSATPVLTAAGFGANVPSSAAITEVRIEMVRTMPDGTNESQHVLGGLDASNMSGGVFRIDNTELSPPLTPADVNDPGFAFEWAGFNLGGTVTFAVDAFALYVEVA